MLKINDENCLRCFAVSYLIFNMTSLFNMTIHFLRRLLRLPMSTFYRQQTQEEINIYRLCIAIVKGNENASKLRNKQPRHKSNRYVGITIISL